MRVIRITEPRGFKLPPVSSTLEEEKAGLFLKPGENNVTPECWDQAGKNPAVRIAITAGLIVDNGDGEAKPLPTEIAQMPLEKARKVIRKMEDTDLIRTARRSSKNRKFHVICDARLKELADDSDAN